MIAVREVLLAKKCFAIVLFNLDLPILFIMGGTSSVGTYIRSVETLDLREDASCTVEEASLPVATYANFGVVDRDGNPMSCVTVEDPSQCILYNMELDEWVDGPSMNYERNLGGTSVRLSDGRYFIIGTGITEE